MHGCRALDCQERTPYLMCAAHWRMVPPELKRLWRVTMLQLDQETPGAGRGAAMDNLAELQRVVQAIERGVPA